MNAHDCPVPGCTESLRTGTFMCLRHWNHVPYPLQKKLGSSWRAARDPKRGHDYRNLAVTEYKRLRQAAIDAVVARFHEQAPLK